ncbi:phosphatase PAP2 family protein [Massilia sp. CF038]|uniref:phosphatase PAP2 family protein n=1 Tax=Massilia sp. CF038 TaxID=1881045 RepID=UPI00091A0D55|nr:phosphatase PAP2 family protein [Massilia sp. CF038]SHH07922.1 undecaprenyl-diphosphatase [Massilia sp. CF038]
MKQRYPRLHRHLAARLNPDEQFGLHLTVGVILLVIAAVLFALIANNVVANAEITHIDQALAQWFHQFARSPWTPLVLAFTNWNHPIGILLMALVLACVLHWRREPYWLLALVLAVPGGLILNVLLKYTFQRVRPSFEEPLVSLATFSFPSGHTSGATVLYGFLAAWLVCSVRSRVLQVAVMLAALTMVVLVGFSRLYLGAHFMSDVLAAMALGSAWLAICITGVSTLRRRTEGRSIT